MRPFFSYYGSKWTGARHYGPPRRELVIEPFAGSAAYSVRWRAERVRLYDLSVDVCDLWDFLINCSDADIAAIPDAFAHDDEMLDLPRGPRLLCGFWVAKGRAEAARNLSPWYARYKDGADCKVWGAAVKRRIIAQKPHIRLWTVDNLSWDQIPVEAAHWHVDPPYNNGPGSRYPHSCQGIDFAALGEWCRALPGAVDVCENFGAEWLPFDPLYSVVSTRGRREGSASHEVVWRNDARV